MPKHIQDNEFEEILQIVKLHPRGIKLKDLNSALGNLVSNRTLQRRLNRLIAKSMIKATGKGPARLYQPVPAFHRAGHNKDPQSKNEIESGEQNIPLSEEGQFLKDRMSQPLSLRKPIGYQFDFLNRYKPNETFYLPLETRNFLHEVGTPETSVDAETHLKIIFNRLLIDLSWNSSRLEGNTYSLLDTKKLIEIGKEAAGKDSEETQMILNHKAAIELLVDPSVEIGFNRYTVCNLHAMLSENLLHEPGACGRIRSRHIAISGSVFQPLNMPQRIQEEFDLLLHLASSIHNPFEQAFFILVHLPYLQPFEDVNKRVSRLAANLPLIQNGLCPLSYADISKEEYTRAILAVYEMNRIEYLRDLFVWAYERSASRFVLIKEVLGEPDPFRLKHREIIIKTMSEILKGQFSKLEAEKIFTEKSYQLPQEERSQFVETIITELTQLHEGNIARFKIKPSEFKAWKLKWDE